MAEQARRTVIAGNWKMYKTIPEALDFIRAVAPKTSEEVDTLLAVPFTAISEAAKAAKGSSLKIGAQNMHSATEGAFTGEIAGKMLLDAGAQFVLIGHSERRRIFGESLEAVEKKLLKSFEIGLKPILCVGESLEEREQGRHFDVVQEQLFSALSKVSCCKNLLVAYEPVWAIGTGKTASPEDAQEMHKYIRSQLYEKFSNEGANCSLLYGGSVKPENSATLLAQEDIDGLLIGGASLKSTLFLEILASGTILDLKT